MNAPGMTTLGMNDRSSPLRDLFPDEKAFRNTFLLEFCKEEGMTEGYSSPFHSDKHRISIVGNHAMDVIGAPSPSVSSARPSGNRMQEFTTRIETAPRAEGIHRRHASGDGEPERPALQCPAKPSNGRTKQRHNGAVGKIGLKERKIRGHPLTDGIARRGFEERR